MDSAQTTIDWRRVCRMTIRTAYVSWNVERVPLHAHGAFLSSRDTCRYASPDGVVVAFLDVSYSVVDNHGD